MSPPPLIYFGQCKASLPVLSCDCVYPVTFLLTTAPLCRVKMGACQQNHDFGLLNLGMHVPTTHSSVLDTLKHHGLCSAIYGAYFVHICWHNNYAPHYIHMHVCMHSTKLLNCATKWGVAWWNVATFDKKYVSGSPLRSHVPLWWTHAECLLVFLSWTTLHSCFSTLSPRISSRLGTR